MYLTFNEYEQYGGNLDESTFNSCIFRAESFLNYNTFNRIKKFNTIPLEVKMCLVELVNLQNQKNDALTVDSNAIYSQTNDGVSITYNNMTAQQLDEHIKYEQKRVIKEYLSDTRNEKNQRVLYRGKYQDE